VGVPGYGESKRHDGRYQSGKYVRNHPYKRGTNH
jgi:hypothetical protein